MEVDLDLDAEVSLPMDAQTALLRIAQGALANVGQHALAHRVGIRLASVEEGVRLTVTDDGMGFDAARAESAASATDSFGLRAMRERVDQLDGRIEVDSAPRAGTTLTVTLPVGSS